MSYSIPQRELLVYADEGAAYKELLQTLEQTFHQHPHVTVTPVSAQDLKNRKTLHPENVMAVLFPGGEKPGYDETLGLKGINLIQDYVASGGVYYGFCKGAYYASRDLHWMPDTSLEVVKQPGLNFFNGLSRGPVKSLRQWDELLTNINYTTADGEQRQAPCLYWGGPAFFPGGHDPNLEVIGRFSDLAGHPPAILKTRHKQGLAILSSVHPEIRASQVPGYITSVFCTSAHAQALQPLRSNLRADQMRQTLWLDLLHHMTKHRQEKGYHRTPGAYEHENSSLPDDLFPAK